ncbi:MAG: sigma-70 family RNA polymerase sigma factor [candidate division KSB1 bacterium]|nr:sigma-70 family RNA polymerase sigma factor [candidate division KSB1 bacterium]MDZ7305197.1 sigma-70 family RNA polymerase sigma factor [candidate division KSB1 bacterium]MDZ7314292.1 sigma-70 family RNA polymerase sigma factor [candidate division KSB1 bacterium]
MTDGDLINKFLDGPGTAEGMNAFNMLVWRWEKPIYNFILRYLGRRDEARDLTQQVFIKVYRNLSRLKDRERFSSWIYQIAVNLCRDLIKQHRRHQSYSLENLQENGALDDAAHPGLTLLPEAALHPDKVVSRNELRDILQKALQEIPEEQRLVVIMKEYQGLKFTEIAEALGVSVNTIKSRMYYGLSALKKILAQWQFDEEAMLYDV